MSGVETRTHTALHIVKGAIVKVLGEGAKWSTSAFVDGNHGRIHVEFNRKPSDVEVKLIEEAANRKIEEDSAIEIFHMDRVEAEKRWGDWIYDRFPIPEHVKELDIFHLPGWNVNACNKKHTKSTGEVGKIVITRTRFRGSRKELEVSYDIE